MKAAVESSQELATLILCLPALTLVPVHSVEESFELNPLFFKLLDRIFTYEIQSTEAKIYQNYL